MQTTEGLTELEESRVSGSECPAIDGDADDGQSPEFEEGFTLKTVIGALFVVFIMLPGALYMGLVAGQGLGSPAQWVTIVLFAEVAKRSFVTLKRQELYILYVVVGALAVTTAGHLGLSGGPFGILVWSQYFAGSPQASSFAREIPTWVVPSLGSDAILKRSLTDAAWFIPIALMVANDLLARVGYLGLGYALFRLTSDVERLPFPMASVAAAGATALAESQSKTETWRWRVFSMGAMCGLIFGFFYLAFPILTGVLLRKPLSIIPIPFFDFTRNTEEILPTALTGLSGDLTLVLSGFVLPFQLVVGMAVGSVLAQVVANPILYSHGMMPTWRHGMGTIETSLSTSLDFWMSAGIGIQLAVALVGIYSVIRMATKARTANQSKRVGTPSLPKGRGDFPVAIAVGAWVLTTAISVTISHRLIPLFPLWILIGFGFVYSPLISYVNARMYGLTGMPVGVPMLKEASILTSGYRNIDVWFAPMPMNDCGYMAAMFREVELTRTKFTSVFKAWALVFPLLYIASFGFWSYFWRHNAVPSSSFPFAQQFWPLHAALGSLWISASKSGADSFLMKALQPDIIMGSGGAAVALFAVMSVLKMPVLYFYGLAGGAASMPHSILPMLGGALLGRYYFERKIGKEKWARYTPVLLAGFSCGMGLIGMISIALSLIAKSASSLPF